MGRKIDLTDQVFGRLTVLREIGRKYENEVLWLCSCKCGAEVKVVGSSLRKGVTSSCGCFQREKSKEANTQHGHACRRTNTKVSDTYNSWQTMIRRCTNPNNDNWHRYGGRGIQVTERWKDFSNFLADMGERPSIKHKLERIDNNGDYEPKNCCWKTQKEQMRNTSLSRLVTAWGETKTLVEWSEQTGIPYATTRRRLDLGWEPERALSEPVRAKEGANK